MEVEALWIRVVRLQPWVADADDAQTVETLRHALEMADRQECAGWQVLAADEAATSLVQLDQEARI